jgi:hypothetical protein
MWIVLRNMWDDYIRLLSLLELLLPFLPSAHVLFIYMHISRDLSDLSDLLFLSFIIYPDLFLSDLLFILFDLIIHLFN